MFSRKERKERKVLFTFRIPRLRWSGRKLRYDKSAQRVLSTPSPLRGTRPGETDPSPALPCMGGSSYNRLVPHQQNIILSLPPGREGVGSEGPWVGPFPKKPLHPSLRAAGREILVSSRLGPRMKSVWNMNSQAHDNMSAPPRQNDDDDGCPQCTASAPILLL